MGGNMHHVYHIYNVLRLLRLQQEDPSPFIEVARERHCLDQLFLNSFFLRILLWGKSGCVENLSTL